MSENLWRAAELPDPQRIQDLQNQLNINRVIATLLVQRGINDYESARNFFRPGLENLHDPFLFNDMNKAVNRINLAIEEAQKILIYGDYDVDGTTSVAMMYAFLGGLTDKLEYYIPDRYKEGYGVSAAGIEYAVNHGFSLIISLDCGIRSHQLVARAAEQGIDFIICDHHLPGDELPPALAILDAKVPGEGYPFKELSGCGVGFKLIEAICLQRNLPRERSLQFLDLVAVSTCSDIVPIVGENRILVKFGLEKLNEHPSLGLKVLKESCIKKKQISTSDVVFYIGPRINAVGRLYDAKTAVKLLTVQTLQEAEYYTGILNQNNAERKDIDEQITRQALEIIENDPGHPEAFTNVLFNPGWHKGVVGIVASRIIEHHYRPTIVMGYSDGKITGSARSIRGFDIHEALIACSDLLLQFGGHTHAAGLSLLPEHLDAFKARFDQTAAKILNREMLQPVLMYDLEISLKEITPGLIHLLQQFEPHGPGNMTPLFLTQNLTDSGYARQIGSEGSHLSLNFNHPGFSKPIKGIAFRKGTAYSVVQNRKPFSAIYSMHEEEFNGARYVQLNLRDLRA